MRWILGIVLVVGCVPAPVYRVQRSARVPRPTVPLRTGEPLAGPIELTLGASSLAQTKTPTGNEDKAMELPDHQVRGELRVRIGRGEIAMVHERAIGHATKLDETQADVDGSGQPWAVGTAIRYAIQPRGAPWSIGLELEALSWMVPYTEIRTCVDNCEGVDPHQEIHSRSSELTVGFGITPAYRFGRWTVFGGVFARNHPTIVRKDEERFEKNFEDTEGGPMNTLVHAGAAVRFGAFTALLLVNQNLDRDPVFYGPGIGVALSATLDPGKLVPSPTPTDEKLAEAQARMRRANDRRRELDER
jgi:hypothetical protein